MSPRVTRTAVRNSAVVAVAVAGILLLAGCAITQSSSGASPSASQSPSAEPAASAEPTTPERSEPVEAPEAGTIDDVIPEAEPGPVVEAGLADPVTLPGSQDAGGSVEIAATDISAVTVTAQTPGDLSGPGLAVTLSIANDAASAVDVNGVVVTLVDAAGNVGVPSASDPIRPFTGTIAPGASADAVYVFVVPEGARDRVELTVSYAAGAPVALLVGQAPN